RRVGVDAIAVELDRGNVVDAAQQRARVENGDDAVAAVGAAALYHFHFAGGEAPVARHSELEADVALRAPAVRQEVLLPAEAQAHRAARRAREQTADDLEVQHLDARAEAPAHDRLDHADARGVHFQAARERQVRVVRHLADR